MKKLIFVALFGSMFFICNTKVEAAQYKDPVKVAKVSAEGAAFNGLKDTDKVVELEDGTFLHGKATIGMLGANRDEMITVDSETAPNAVTVEAAKEILSENEGENNFNQMLRGVSWSFNYKSMPYGASVNGHFSRSVGWNSLNTVYQSTGGGPYLRYYSGYDSAMVGTAQQATRTFSGSLSGNFLSADTYRYFPGINTMYTHYSSSNVQHQSFQIANID